MDPTTQMQKDRSLLERVDKFGKGLSKNEVAYVESFTRWLEGGKPLTPAQRKVLEDIDERRVP